MRTPTLTLLLSLWTFGLLATDKPLRQTQGKPNVVLLLSDDHAWNDYSFMGHPHVKTPNIDKLAGESVAFPRGYVLTAL